MYSPLLELENEQAYRDFYEENYCITPIIAHDSIVVTFDRHQFDHAFYKSRSRKEGDKSLFDHERAKRMSWISRALRDPSLKLYAGYDNKKKRIDHTRRVTIVVDDKYVIVIRLLSDLKRGKFVTAWIIDNPDLLPLLSCEEWNPSLTKKIIEA